MHDSVTANKNQYKKLKMEKHAWPVKATSRDVEGYEQPEETYKKTSAFTTIGYVLPTRSAVSGESRQEPPMSCVGGSVGGSVGGRMIL